ncbi:FUSC family protein [Streptomyces sp. NPDC058001]|uniref:FUSC family protein n=1 Tax=Streptomyces sp. NPDC058001 TaxID=3346300 RepID=UPI0036E048F6
MRARTTPRPPSLALPLSRVLPRSVPPWLGHALRAQRGPVPWSAVVRGALAAGPLLLLAVLAGHPTAGVVAALGAMFAGINDRPGSRHASVHRLGVPALAGATGLLIGSYAAGLRGGEGPALPVTLGLTALLAGLGFIGGALSAIGPVASGAGTQLLVAAAVGVGMPLPEPPIQRALLFLAGAGWLLTLRLVLPSPGARRLDIERAAVADVYEAVAALLRAAGGADAVARRVALTAALDQAQDALRGPRPLRRRHSGAERKLRAQYAAALPLAEAATALAWRGAPLPARAADGPSRLAEAVREGRAPGPLPAPARSTAGLRALDDALLHAAESFDTGTTAHAAPTPTGPALRTYARRALGPAGREYGVRVALCLGVSTAVAQSLHHPHWYWLPATAVFLVKPDLGPLASRVLCRALGTLLGAGLFAGLAALLPSPYGIVGVVAVAGALIPVATRHFAAQTAVVTVLVLGLVLVGGEPQAAASRIGETLLACAIVLLVGHLPLPGQRGHGVRTRLDIATRAADDYLGHVLGGSEDRAASWALRREAYRSLAQVRAAAALSAAELTVLARHTAGTAETAARLELLVDATTATAVHLNDSPRPLSTR